MWPRRVPRIGCAGLLVLVLLVGGSMLLYRAGWNEGFATGLLTAGTEGGKTVLPYSPSWGHPGGGLLPLFFIGMLMLGALAFLSWRVLGSHWRSRRYYRSWPGHGPGATAGQPSAKPGEPAGPHDWHHGHMPPWWCGQDEPPAGWAAPPWWERPAPPAPPAAAPPGEAEKPEPPAGGDA